MTQSNEKRQEYWRAIFYFVISVWFHVIYTRHHHHSSHAWIYIYTYIQRTAFIIKCNERPIMRGDAVKSFCWNVYSLFESFFFFCNKPKAPSVCKLDTIILYAFQPLFFCSHHLVRLSLLSHCLCSSHSLLKFIFIFLFFSLVYGLSQFCMKLQEEENNNVSEAGSIHSLSFCSTKLNCTLSLTDFIYRSVCVGCWIKLPVS